MYSQTIKNKLYTGCSESCIVSGYTGSKDMKMSVLLLMIVASCLHQIFLVSGNR